MSMRLNLKRLTCESTARRELVQQSRIIISQGNDITRERSHTKYTLGREDVISIVQRATVHMCTRVKKLLSYGC